MATVIVGITMSLDGFVADSNGSVAPLYADMQSWQDTDYIQEITDQTGAVLMGRRSYEMGDLDSWGDYEFQVPIFVLTHRPPEQTPKQVGNLNFTFVTDGIESAVAQAKAAAGEKGVQVVGGVSVAAQVLRAGLADELWIDIMPLLLGEGLPYFGDPALSGLTVRKISVREFGQRTCMRFACSMTSTDV